MKGFEPQVIAMQAATNTGYALSVGYSFKQGSANLRKAVIDIEKALTELISSDNHKLIFVLIPRSLRKYIPLKYWPRMCESVGASYDFLFDCIDRHAENYNAEDESVCLLDTMRQDYLQGRFTYSDVFHTVWTSLIAAGDTTSVSVSLMWSNLARWPEWQQKIQNEIDNNRIISIEKWEHLPLTAAFFYETWRWLPAHHRSLFHSVTKKIDFEGFSFGKDTIFSINTAGVCMNPEYFPDPFKFDPTRFLDSNGGLKRNKNMFQFGFGRRSCPGQATAELQILLFTVNLLRRCNINMDPDQPLLNPKTEEEWFSLFSRRPTHAYQGGFMLVENTRVTVTERQK